MILKKALLFIFILVSCFFLQLEGQNKEAITKLAILAKNYNNFSKRYVQERVYLHMDNSAYFLGDTLWFKAYVTSSSFHRLSPDSWILYTELVSPEGQIVETKKLPIVNGSCHGHFDIDSSYLSGFYEVRAYTRAMLIFGEDHIFSRVVPVFKQPEKAGNYNQLLSDYRHYRDSETSRKKKKTISLSFYPEGGHLLQGVQNTLAIKAVDSEGKDVFVKGDILDRSGLKIASFTTAHRGMCRFTFIPNSKKYKARVMLGGEKYEFDLPDIEESGIIATIDSYSSDDSVSLKLLKSGDVTIGDIGMAISCRGQLYYLNILNDTVQYPLDIKIPKSQLSNGVHEFILFDPLGTPLIERKFFISLTDGKYVNKQAHTRTVSISASDVKNEYKPNEKIGLNFMVKDEKGEPVKTSFSLSIRDPHGNVDTYNDDNVLTHLLLSSEVKGFIPDAGYYFESDDEVRRKELDLLLMVQAWSRYPWKSLANVEPFNEEQYVEKGFIISGTVYKAKGTSTHKPPVPNVIVKSVLKRNDYKYMGECITDENGRFNFMFKDIYYDWKAFISLENAKLRVRSKVFKVDMIVLDENRSPKLKNYSFYEKYTPVVDMFEMDSVANNHVLEEIGVISKRRKYIIDDSPIVEDMLINANECLNWFSKLGVDFRVLELNTVHVLQYISHKHKLKKGRVKYVISKQARYQMYNFPELLVNLAYFESCVIHRDFETRSRNMGHNSHFGKIDNVNTGVSLRTHKDLLSYYPKSEIGVLNHRHLDADSIPDYVVELKWQSSVDNIIATSQTHRALNFQGYSESKEFYSIDYSKKSLPPSDDYRRTLYWNPDVKTDESGKAKIEFYNNSRCKDLNIDAQTISLKGEVGVYEKKGGKL